MKVSVLLLFVFASLTYAKAASQPPKPPAISTELQLRFFKARAEQLQAVEQAEQARAVAQEKTKTAQALVQEMMDACGKTYNLSVDKAGNPVCKPLAVVEPEKKGKK